MNDSDKFKIIKISTEIANSIGDLTTNINRPNDILLLQRFLLKQIEIPQSQKIIVDLCNENKETIFVDGLNVWGYDGFDNFLGKRFLYDIGGFDRRAKQDIITSVNKFLGKNRQTSELRRIRDPNLNRLEQKQEFLRNIILLLGKNNPNYNYVIVLRTPDPAKEQIIRYNNTNIYFILVYMPGNEYKEIDDLTLLFFIYLFRKLCISKNIKVWSHDNYAWITQPEFRTYLDNNRFFFNIITRQNDIYDSQPLTGRFDSRHLLRYTPYQPIETGTAVYQMEIEPPFYEQTRVELPSFEQMDVVTPSYVQMDIVTPSAPSQDIKIHDFVTVNVNNQLYLFYITSLSPIAITNTIDSTDQRNIVQDPQGQWKIANANYPHTVTFLSQTSDQILLWLFQEKIIAQLSPHLQNFVIPFLSTGSISDTAFLLASRSFTKEEKEQTINDFIFYIFNQKVYNGSLDAKFKQFVLLWLNQNPNVKDIILSNDLTEQEKRTAQELFQSFINSTIS